MSDLAVAEPVTPSSRRLWPVLVVLAVLVFVVGGGYVLGGALSQPAGPPVELAGVVTVQPLSGWEVAMRFHDPDGIRLTRGSGNLDVFAVPFGEGPAQLAEEYVRTFLEPEADRLSVSREIETVQLDSGRSAARIPYVGTFGRSQTPIEGEVTAIVSDAGVGVVFDAWAPQGMLPYVVGDVRTMIDGTEVA
jgi:hypothetical protein